MPFRQRGSYGMRRPMRRSLGTIVDSNKNIVDIIDATVGGTNKVDVIVQAVDSATLAGTTTVERGSKLFGVIMQLSMNGTGATGVNNAIRGYIIKNPGDNLTVPNPGTTGSSNEKKFVIFEFMANLGRVQDGAPRFDIKKYVKIPRVYQRFGADDKLQLVLRTETGVNSNYCTKFIYKWYK